jgi:hypothetical protein
LLALGLPRLPPPLLPLPPPPPPRFSQGSSKSDSESLPKGLKSDSLASDSSNSSS